MKKIFKKSEHKKISTHTQLQRGRGDSDIG